MATISPAKERAIPARNGAIRCVARNLEDAKRLLHVALPTRDGRLRFGVQFYDGAQHELRIRALRGTTLLNEWKQAIEVEAQSKAKASA